MLTSNRLNSSLNGAYLIWDDLLATIASQLQHFLPSLVAILLCSLTSSNTIDAARDVDKEAFAMWLLHVMDSDDFWVAGMTGRDDILADVIKWCCLYPGHWTQHVGHELLEEHGESVRAEWENLFEASLIRSGEDATAQVVPGAGPGDTPGVAESAEVKAETVETACGWSKAVASMSVPIGVVQ